MENVDPTLPVTLPKFPGFSFHSFSGVEDYARLAALRTEVSDMDKEEFGANAAQVQHAYETQEHFDVHRDLFFVEQEGRLVGYGRVFIFDEAAEPRRIFSLQGITHPTVRGKGLGRAIIRANERRARQIEMESPSGRDAILQVFTVATRPGSIALLESEGYHHVRSFFMMVRSNLDAIPDLSLPEGIETRPARQEHYRQIWDASDDAFRDHWGYAEPTEAMYQAYLTSDEFQPELWQVAWQGDEVVGMVRSFINRSENEHFGFRRGWTEDICVRKPWRGKGIARALIARSLQTLKEHGMEQAALGVDSENPTGALHLYESMGYQVAHEDRIYQKPMQASSVGEEA